MTMTRTMKTLALTMGLLAMSTATASASSVYGTNTNMTLSGSRSAAAGDITATGRFTSLVVGWNITQSAGVYHYEYTFNISKQNYSHILLELSQGADANNIDDFVRNLTGASLSDDSPRQWTKNIGNSNPNLPDPGIFGVKFENLADSNSLTIKFDSDKAPVWGNFYTKAAKDEYAYNAAMDIKDFDSGNIMKFIARPDSTNGPTVPEPTSIVMLGLGGLGLLGVAARRRNAQSA